MTMQELVKKSSEDLDALALVMAERGNMRALGLINEVREYAHKRVKVVKGRKVPIGTVGEVFWMGSRDHSKYGDPWGIYTSVRVGIRTDFGDVRWTDINNIEVIKTKTIYIVQEKRNSNFVAEFDNEENAQVFISEWTKEIDDVSADELEIVTAEEDEDYILIEW